MKKLTHIDSQGKASMVDVSEKKATSRTAVAIGKISVGPEIMEIIQTGGVKKGDVFGVARIAGIMAAKKTADLIPLCHPLQLSKCGVDFEIIPESYEIKITASAKTDGKTGVEMEALTAVSIAALTIYDMCKAVNKGMMIHNIHLARKTGGKSGDIQFSGQEKD